MEVLEAVASLAVALAGVGSSVELTVNSLRLTVMARSEHRTYFAITDETLIIRKNIMDISREIVGVVFFLFLFFYTVIILKFSF